MSFFNKRVSKNYEDTIDADDVENVIVDVSIGDVNVKTTDDDTITYVIHNLNDLSLFDIVSEVDGDEYRFEMTPRGDVTINGNLSIDIKIPEKEFDTLRFKTTSGDLRVSGVECEELYVETSSGDIIVKGDAETLYAKSSSGDIDSKTSSETIEINSTSGDISVTAPADDVNVSSTSGDIELELSPSCDGKMKVSSVSGDISIELEDAYANVSHSTISGDYSDDSGNEGYEMDGVVSSVSGDITITN